MAKYFAQQFSGGKTSASGGNLSQRTGVRRAGSGRRSIARGVGRAVGKSYKTGIGRFGLSKGVANLGKQMGTGGARGIGIAAARQAAGMGAAGMITRALPVAAIAAAAFGYAYDYYENAGDWAKIKDANEGYPYAAWGFNKTCDIGLTSGGGGIGRAGPIANSPNLSCGTGGVVPASGSGPNAYGKPFTIKPTDRWFAFGRRSSEPAARMVLQQQFYRPAAGKSGVIAWQQTVRPIADGAPNPATEAATITNPSVAVAPLPAYQLGALEIALWANALVAAAGVHTLAPPTGTDREKKSRNSAAVVGALISKLYDATTEAKDVVDILYDNLGKKCKGAKSMSDKSYCVWKNINTLDVDAAIGDLIRNHFEDKVYGRIFGTVGRNTPYGSMQPGYSPNNSWFG